jgi:hypothetical protein
MARSISGQAVAVLSLQKRTGRSMGLIDAPAE